MFQKIFLPRARWIGSAVCVAIIIGFMLLLFSVQPRYHLVVLAKTYVEGYEVPPNPLQDSTSEIEDSSISNRVYESLNRHSR